MYSDRKRDNVITGGLVSLLALIGFSYWASETATPPPAPPQPWELPLKWVAAPEDSVVATAVAYGNQPTIERCWKRSERYDCLRVEGRISPGETEPSSFGFFRYSGTKLPTQSPMRTVYTDGYYCSLGGSLVPFSEDIYRDRVRLTSNVIRSSYDGEPWSAEYVNKYMAENRVGGWRHFDCISVAGAINRGTIATAGTTSVIYDMIE